MCIFLVDGNGKPFFLLLFLFHLGLSCFYRPQVPFGPKAYFLLFLLLCSAPSPYMLLWLGSRIECCRDQ